MNGFDQHQVEYNALPKALHILRMNISQLKTIHRQIHEINTHTALNTMIVVIGRIGQFFCLFKVSYLRKQPYNKFTRKTL